MFSTSKTSLNLDNKQTTLELSTNLSDTAENNTMTDQEKNTKHSNNLTIRYSRKKSDQTNQEPNSEKDHHRIEHQHKVINREERLRLVREKQEQELNKRKHDIEKNLKRKEELRQKQLTERQKRINESRLKETEKRLAVEERRKQRDEMARTRLNEIIKRQQEREYQRIQQIKTTKIFNRGSEWVLTNFSTYYLNGNRHNDHLYNEELGICMNNAPSTFNKAHSVNTLISYRKPNYKSKKDLNTSLLTSSVVSTPSEKNRSNNNPKTHGFTHISKISGLHNLPDNQTESSEPTIQSRFKPPLKAQMQNFINRLSMPKKAEIVTTNKSEVSSAGSKNIVLITSDVSPTHQKIKAIPQAISSANHQNSSEFLKKSSSLNEDKTQNSLLMPVKNTFFQKPLQDKGLITNSCSSLQQIAQSCDTSYMKNNRSKKAKSPIPSLNEHNLSKKTIVPKNEKKTHLESNNLKKSISYGVLATNDSYNTTKSPIKNINNIELKGINQSNFLPQNNEIKKVVEEFQENGSDFIQEKNIKSDEKQYDIHKPIQDSIVHLENSQSEQTQTDLQKQMNTELSHINGEQFDMKTDLKTVVCLDDLSKTTELSLEIFLKPAEATQNFQEVEEQEKICIEEDQKEKELENLEEEELKLKKLARIQEEQRIQFEIEQKELERRLKEENDKRMKEEADLKAKKDLERQELERSEKIKRDEEERLARKKRIDLIMKRVQKGERSSQSNLTDNLVTSLNNSNSNLNNLLIMSASNNDLMTPNCGPPETNSSTKSTNMVSVQADTYTSPVEHKLKAPLLLQNILGKTKLNNIINKYAEDPTISSSTLSLIAQSALEKQKNISAESQQIATVSSSSAPDKVSKSHQEDICEILGFEGKQSSFNKMQQHEVNMISANNQSCNLISQNEKLSSSTVFHYSPFMAPLSFTACEQQD